VFFVVKHKQLFSLFFCDTPPTLAGQHRGLAHTPSFLHERVLHGGHHVRLCLCHRPVRLPTHQRGALPLAPHLAHPRRLAAALSCRCFFLLSLGHIPLFFYLTCAKSRFLEPLLFSYFSRFLPISSVFLSKRQSIRHHLFCLYHDSDVVCIQRILTKFPNFIPMWFSLDFHTIITTPQNAEKT